MLGERLHGLQDDEASRRGPVARAAFLKDYTKRL